MTLKEIVNHLENSNPYPVDVFPEPSYEDWHEIGKFLQEHGKNPDRIFAKWGRMVWNNCIAQLKELTED
jgi:hypothetical protein